MHQIRLTTHIRDAVYDLANLYCIHLSSGGSALGKGGGHGPLQIVARHPNLAALLTHCGQSIRRKK